ncbi:MAG: YbaN family protein [Hyphomonadaceae bacterium]
MSGNPPEPAPGGAPEPGARRRKALRPVYLVCGVLLTAIGAAGLVLPLLPGTVFLILAAACFARSSPRFEAWLLNHSHLGPPVRAWRETGAIPLNAKIIAIGAMTLSVGIVWFTRAPIYAKWITTAILAACALYVGTRPGVAR